VPAYREGVPWSPEDEDGTEPEWQAGFLTAHFVLHRFAQSGRLSRIDVIGEPIPVQCLPAGTVRTVERESLIVEGSPERLAEAMGNARGGAA
jgi:hypothetical protein